MKIRDHLSWEVYEYATTKGEALIRLKENTVDTLVKVKDIANFMDEKLNVKRIALVWNRDEIRLIPLHGLHEQWSPWLADDGTGYRSFVPTYITSTSGPLCDDRVLNDMVKKLGGVKNPSYEYLGNVSDDGLFVKLVKGEIKQWRIWENETYVAFLTPFPNCPGCAVLISRKRLTSNVFKMELEDYELLMEQIPKVRDLIQSGLECTNVGVVFEGMEIDYTHVKFFPNEPKNGNESHVKYQEIYPGYVTNLNGPLVDAARLNEWRKLYGLQT